MSLDHLWSILLKTVCHWSLKEGIRKGGHHMKGQSSLEFGLWAQDKRKAELNVLCRSLLAFDRSIHSGLHMFSCPFPHKQPARAAQTKPDLPAALHKAALCACRDGAEAFLPPGAPPGKAPVEEERHGENLHTLRMLFWCCLVSGSESVWVQ